ncbi:MAG: ATP-binding protein [Bryobacteraceae bacterium]
MFRARDFRHLVRDFRRLERGLRFRLTAGYALFFAVLLIGVTTLFHERLAGALDDRAHAVLDQEWAAMKGYLRIEENSENQRNEAIWYYDPLDNEESRIVSNIRRIYVVMDQNGAIITDYNTQSPAVSPTYAELGIERPAEVRANVKQALTASKPNAEPKAFWSVRRNAQGEQFLVRAGIVYDQGHMLGGRTLPYYVSIGSSLAQYNNILRQFTWIYAGVIPGSLLLGSILGWVIIGRALSPVRAVAQAAQRISGSNLKLRIPARNAGDELDYLILTFNRMIERLETSFEQMKQFTADVSHELRTPITAIRGQLEVAMFTAQTTDQYREAMINALQDIDRLSQMVRALLLLSQAESGQLVLQKSRLDLCEVVRDLVEQYQIPAEAAGVRLEAELSEACPAEVDRVQIERMIVNLLSNAVKFTPEGGLVKVSVRHAPDEAAAEGAPEHIEIVVEDTGQGIAAEHLPHIYGRFYRIHTPGAAPAPEQGLGLGLSFVAWIVKAHHGTIGVVSAVGKGTRFTIALPAPGIAAAIPHP